MSAQLVTAGIELAIQLLLNNPKVSQILMNAHAEGRTSPTPEEWKVIHAEADSARQSLVAAIGS